MPPLVTLSLRHRTQYPMSLPGARVALGGRLVQPDTPSTLLWGHGTSARWWVPAGKPAVALGSATL